MKININTKSKRYSIIVENNSINKHLKKIINNDQKKFFIIDKKISKQIKDKLGKIKNSNIIIIKSSEKIKSFNYYTEIIEKLLDAKIDRHSTLIAIGGGTIGDLSGFIASTVLRGVKFILVPTTLLSQVDSSIGGKNGINTKFGKNLVGTFFQPDGVIIDPLLLKSLNKREIKSGYAEILKHALINDKKFYLWLKKNYNDLFSLNLKKINYAIIKSIKIKAKYVNKDEKENLNNSHSRAILNFGHTFGHAIETRNKYNSDLTHGEAISIGMSLAAKISYNLNDLSKKEYNDILSHLNNAGYLKYNKKILDNKIFKVILADKKNKDNKINLILLKKIGKSYYKKGLHISRVKNLIK